jgi:hypothetical protein
VAVKSELEAGVNDEGTKKEAAALSSSDLLA